MTTDNPNNTGPHLDPQAMVGFLTYFRDRGVHSTLTLKTFIALAEHPEGVRTKDMVGLVQVNTTPTAVVALQKLTEVGLAYFICKPRCTTWQLTEEGWGLAGRFFNLYPTQA